HRGIAARHGHVIEMSKPLKCGQPRDEHFSSPDAAIGAISRAVKREPDDWSGEPMLGHAASNVGVMMLYPDERQSAHCRPILRPGCRQVSGMQIVYDGSGLDLEGAHQVIERVLEELEAGQVFEVAEVLALVDRAPARERKDTFEVAAHSEQRRS